MLNVTQNILLLLLAQLSIGHLFAQHSGSPIDITSQWGLEYPLRLADSTSQRLHMEFVSEPVLFDFDGDNDLDLFLPYGYAPASIGLWASNRFYANTDSGWTDITIATGLNAFGPAGNGAVGDINGDGYLDLYLCSLGEDRLLLNVRGEYFEDISAALPSGAPAWSSAALFFDANLDGNLDLYVANYLDYAAEDTVLCMPEYPGVMVVCDPQMFDAAANRFYYGDGLGGFTDASTILSAREKNSRSLKVLLMDANGDQALDLLVLSYRAQNLLYLSNREGGMEEAALKSGLAVAADGSDPVWTAMDAADINNDGYEDVIFVTADGHLHSMLNDGNGHFFPGNYQTGFFTPGGTDQVGQLVATDINSDGFDELMFITLPVADITTADPGDSTVTGVIWERTYDGGKFAKTGNWQPVRLDTSIIIWGVAHNTADSLNAAAFAMDTTLAYSDAGSEASMIRASGEPDPVQYIDSIATDSAALSIEINDPLMAVSARWAILDTMFISGWAKRLTAQDLDGDGQDEVVASYGYGAYQVWQWEKGTAEHFVGLSFTTNGRGTSPIGGVLELITPGRVRRKIIKGESTSVILLGRRERGVDITFTWIDGVTANIHIESLNGYTRIWAAGEE